MMAVPGSQSSEFQLSESKSVQAKKEPDNEIYQEYMEKLKQLATPEEKIALGLVFMRGAISQEGMPCFREFWEARRDLLLLFKQNINPTIRSRLWNEYVELTVEARRLKEILEEQSVFAMEQIDLAITALEQEAARIPQTLEKMELIVLPFEARSIQARADVYQRIQGELNVLNHLAMRLNGLRRETVKTEMRIRFKTKFFRRLSELGNQIFPRRKQLIEQIGSEFELDIDRFVESYFQGTEVVGAPYYALRDEIKALQNMAKVITLNTAVFTKTRLKLSECWDKIKVLEKAHKQEVQQKRQIFSENRAVLEARFAELKQQVGGQELMQIDAAIEQFQQEMRAVDLGREDIWFFRNEFAQLRAPLIEQQENRRREMEEMEKERLRVKKEKAISLRQAVASLLQRSSIHTDVLVSEFQQIQNEVAELSLGKYEQQQFDRLMRPVKDLIAERKESALLNLSDDQKSAIQQLREVLEQRKIRRQEVKDQLEIYRKVLGGSNLDFEKAMTVREQIELEKERLERANVTIQEVEQKIMEIERNA
jgi:hypothetical protein